MQISEWIELIRLLHIESFEAIVAELRDRYQENTRNSSPVLIIFNTLQVLIRAFCSAWDCMEMCTMPELDFYYNKYANLSMQTVCLVFTPRCEHI